MPAPGEMSRRPAAAEGVGIGARHLDHDGDQRGWILGARTWRGRFAAGWVRVHCLRPRIPKLLRIALGREPRNGGHAEHSRGHGECEFAWVNNDHASTGTRMMCMMAPNRQIHEDDSSGVAGAQ